MTISYSARPTKICLEFRTSNKSLYSQKCRIKITNKHTQQKATNKTNKETNGQTEGQTENTQNIDLQSEKTVKKQSPNHRTCSKFSNTKCNSFSTKFGAIFLLYYTTNIP